MMRDDYDFSNAKPNPYADRLGQGLLSTPVSRGEQPPSGVVEVDRDADGSFRWRLKTADDRVLVSSDESYATLASCREAVAALFDAMSCPTTVTCAA